jgi:bacteriorhodopsin
MTFFRWLIPALFLLAGLLFAAFMFTGNPRYKRIGLRVLLTSLLAAFAFFAVLIAINLSE